MIPILWKCWKVNWVKSSKAFQSSTFDYHYRKTISDWLEHMFSTHTLTNSHTTREASFQPKRVLSTYITLLIIFWRNIWFTISSSNHIYNAFKYKITNWYCMKRGKCMFEWIVSLSSTSSWWKYWIHSENFKGIIVIKRGEREESPISNLLHNVIIGMLFHDPPTSKLHMTKYFKILTTECNKYTQLTSPAS